MTVDSIRVTIGSLAGLWDSSSLNLVRNEFALSFTNFRNSSRFSRRILIGDVPPLNDPRKCFRVIHQRSDSARASN